MKSLQSTQIPNKALFSLPGEASKKVAHRLDFWTGCLADLFLLHCFIEETEDIAEEDLFTKLGNIFKP